MSLRDRLRRFERLERPRKEAPETDERPGGDPGTEDRFDDLGARPPPRPAPAGPSAPPPTAGDRFAPPRPRPPELEQRDGDQQPFLRCMRCETDSSRYARTCTTCGEELHTEAQQAFNQKLWEARKRERDELERENAGRRAAQATAEAEVAEARRQAAAEMARQVGERERWRMEGGGTGGSWGGGPWGGAPPYDPDDPYGPRDPTPVGVRILRAIKSPAWRLAAIGALVLLAILVVVLARRYPPLVIILISLLIGLFSPRRRYRRRLWW